MTSAALALLAALAMLAGPAVAATTADEGFDAYVETLRVQQSIPGLSVAVIHGRKLVKLQGYGYADVASGRRMTGETPMNIASVSKPFVGTQILRLADRGRLDLDADVNRYLPFRLDNPKVEGEVITLRHLATHTSGVVDVDAEGETPQSDHPLPLDDYLKGVLAPGGAGYRGGRHFLAAQPGATRAYSNMGARVAGLAAERAGRAPLAKLMAREVFRPLGMRQTSWDVRDYAPGVLATRYAVTACKPSPCEGGTAKRFEPQPHNFNTNFPDGGMQSSARDLAIFAQVILNGGRRSRYVLVAPATFQEMFRPQLKDPAEARQRFFWREREGMIGHSGSDTGVFTSFQVDAEKGDALVVLMNRTPDLSTEYAMGQLIAKIKATYF